MKKFFASALLAAFFTLSGAVPEIYLAPGAPPAEENAAMELQKGLKRIFGFSAPISRKDPDRCTFFVGQSPAAGKVLGVADFSLFKPDEILLKKVNGKMYLLGDRPRGTIFAVYEFLERAYGVRFWTAEVEHWPREKKFFLPEIDHRYAPVFLRRYVYYDLSRKSPFCVKLRNNRYWPGPRWGGTEEIIGFCHTFGLFVPAKKYFAAHPEWFAMLNGKRVSTGQPCLTSPGFRRALIEGALAALRKRPAPKVISVSQNDGGTTLCECARCTAFIRKHGNKTDLLMDTVNEVADAIAAEFPKVQVETLAYSFTREPPKTVVPRKNVLIRFASGRADQSRPFDSDANARNRDFFKAWRKFGNPLAVWTYETNFERFYMPFPNWRGLLNDPRFFADNGVIDIFQQGSQAGPVADLADLRVWVLGKLQWDPYQDPKKLVREFAEGFYGPAAPYILAYIDHMTAVSRKGGKSFHFELKAADLLRAREILLQGEKAAASDRVLRQRLRIAAVPVNLAVLQMPEVWEKPEGMLRGADWRKLLDDQLKIMAEAKVKHLAEETHTPDMMKRNILLLLSHEKGPLPVPGYPAGTKWKQISAADCLRFHPYRFADDPTVPGGRVVEVDCTHLTWTSQLHRPPAGTWDVYVDLRCFGKDAVGKAASFGCYDQEGKKGLLGGSAKAEDIRGPGWHPVKIGRLVSRDACYLWCAPAVNRTVEKLQIRRYIFVKVK